MLKTQKATRALPAALVVTLGLAVSASVASAATSFERLPGFKSPGTPAKYNKVGVIKVGPSKAPNVLVLNPGTSASAAYFVPLANTVVRQAKGWQVWSVERRENLLEDHSQVDRAKAGTATAKELFDYYLGYIGHPEVTKHFVGIPNEQLQFAKRWGMRTEIEDLRRVVSAAAKGGRRVVVGGHSLGGSITAAYATWDFRGTPGARGLSGLVFIDGGSSPEPVTTQEAQKSLDELNAGSPWLAFGGIAAPFAGLFNVVAAGLVKLEPNVPSRLQAWGLLPANLNAPFPVTNVGGYGFALDSETSPPELAAAQAHLGRSAASGDPRGWDRAGELTPIQRFADMFFGTGLEGHDGTAWYHPMKLTIDSRAVAAGNRNPAQKLLDVHATHGDDLPRDLEIYAFGAALGGKRVLDAARALAKQSHIPRRQLTLVDRAKTYAHNDPNSASPGNDFVKYLVPFLRRIARR